MQKSKIRRGASAKSAFYKKFFSSHRVRALTFLGFIIAFFVCFFKLWEPRLLPIHHVKMHTHFKRIDEAALEKVIPQHIKGFFSTNMGALKEALSRLPLVDEVFIQRIWPDTLSITVTELEIVGNWKERAAVTSRGEIVSLEQEAYASLPMFIGDETKVNTLYQEYIHLSDILRPSHLSITKIMLNSRQSWQITLGDKTTVLLGRKDIESRLTTLMKVYPKLKKMHGEMKSIDIRHSNGVSVGL